jgi:hypothetical protein
VNLPFTPDQFFEVFGAYNRSLWPFALALWLYAVASVVVLARSGGGRGRFLAVSLAVQWAWAALVYHAMFFSSINPAAWFFGGLFLVESALFAWFGVIRDQLHFSLTRSPRHVVAWMLILYSLVYPFIAQAEGHAYPEAPTFGVPCPTTLLTIGFLFAANPPWPVAVALIPVLWAFIGGSAAFLLGVRADAMLWLAGPALMACVLMPARPRVRA